jgi:hypothetical protein
MELTHMTTNRIRTLIAVAGLAAIPALASASNEKAALDSCARALVASMATKSAKPLKLIDSRETDGDTLIADHYEFMIVARRARDNAPVARATCYTNDQDQVVELQQERLKVTDF